MSNERVKNLCVIILIVVFKMFLHKRKKKSIQLISFLILLSDI